MWTSEIKDAKLHALELWHDGDNCPLFMVVAFLCVGDVPFFGALCPITYHRISYSGFCINIGNNPSAPAITEEAAETLMEKGQPCPFTKEKIEGVKTWSLCKACATRILMCHRILASNNFQMVDPNQMDLFIEQLRCLAIQLTNGVPCNGAMLKYAEVLRHELEGMVNRCKEQEEECAIAEEVLKKLSEGLSISIANESNFLKLGRFIEFMYAIVELLHRSDKVAQDLPESGGTALSLQGLIAATTECRKLYRDAYRRMYSKYPSDTTISSLSEAPTFSALTWTMANIIETAFHGGGNLGEFLMLDLLVRYWCKSLQPALKHLYISVTMPDGVQKCRVLPPDLHPITEFEKGLELIIPFNFDPEKTKKMDKMYSLVQIVALWAYSNICKKQVWLQHEFYRKYFEGAFNWMSEVCACEQDVTCRRAFDAILSSLERIQTSHDVNQSRRKRPLDKSSVQNPDCSRPKV